jgi:anti-anti-sigma factor
MAQDTQVTLRENGGLLVLDIRGEFTTFADATLIGAYHTASERGARNILLNFSGVNYLNSAGISIIIGLLMEARQAEQQLLITGLTPHYRKIFQMMGLAQHAPLFESEGEALQFVTPDTTVS